ncbi:MAG TPA: LysR family transcriptional regulator [Polyangiales bacterium]
MARPDLNLLVTLDVLLAEGSVARAAKRLRLSASAMSRTLARLRAATGDPLLVRAGRRLVPTPRALELRGRVGPLVQEAEAALRPAEQVDLQRLARTFTLRTSEGFVETFGPRLIDRVTREAPQVQLRFLQKPHKESEPLREGNVDLETGVLEQSTGPELLSNALFRDRLVGVVRAGHPLTKGRLTAARYAGGAHVGVARDSRGKEPVDGALQDLGLARKLVVLLPGGFASALALARCSELIATVPEHHTGALRAGMHTFALPVAVPAFTVSLLWHPRLDADAAHRWLRGCVREVCNEQLGPAFRRAQVSRASPEGGPRPRRTRTSG